MTKEDKDHGWAPDVGEGGSERAAEAKEKAFDKPSDETGEGRRISEEERAGVDPTDPEPPAPHGVGESTRKSGEDQGDEAGTEGTKGVSDRPYGVVDDEG
jgi:hypothetical protein